MYRLIKTERPGQLIRAVEVFNGRMPTLQEVVQLRLAVMSRDGYLLYTLFAVCRTLIGILTLGRVKISYIPDRFKVWTNRITTSTHLVRWVDENGIDTVFFYDSQLSVAQSAAFDGRLSDGGMQYPAEMLAEIVTSDSPRMPYAKYLSTPGGHFHAAAFAAHNVFATACESTLWQKYVDILDRLSILDHHQAGLFSGWVPQGIEPGYGRAIALGYGGEAWYPPNNSTVGHATLVV